LQELAALDSACLTSSLPEPTLVQAFCSAVPAVPPSCWASSLHDYTAESTVCSAFSTADVVVVVTSSSSPHPNAATLATASTAIKSLALVTVCVPLH
jgi:hypothetical protein